MEKKEEAIAFLDEAAQNRGGELQEKTLLVKYAFEAAQELEWENQSSLKGFCWSFDCGLALAGFGLSFASLATLTAATGGLTTAIAVAGFQVASIALVRTCSCKK